MNVRPTVWFQPVRTNQQLHRRERQTALRVTIGSQAARSHKQGTPDMDHSNHVRLIESELNSNNLNDAIVYGADDAKIGKVAHVHGMGKSGEVIVDVGGFLGMGAKPVSLKISQLDFMRDAHGHVHATTTWSKDEMKALPEHTH
jgi:PRC-barrel domain